MSEVRNADDQVLKQYVWGTQYIDELVQVGSNQDPENADAGSYLENDCDQFYYALQDANFNVLGIVNKTGILAERYEYTPYGQRTVYTHGWLRADANNDGRVNAGDLAWVFHVSGSRP